MDKYVFIADFINLEVMTFNPYYMKKYSISLIFDLKNLWAR